MVTGAVVTGAVVTGAVVTGAVVVVASVVLFTLVIFIGLCIAPDFNEYFTFVCFVGAKVCDIVSTILYYNMRSYFLR